jgi:glycerol dehydrogenase
MADAGTVQSLIAPRRYIQGRGVLASIGRHVAELGRQPLLIADENVWKLSGQQAAAGSH